MKKPTNTEKRHAGILEKMRKAMPEIRQQLAVYEKNIASGKLKEPIKVPSGLGGV